MSAETTNKPEGPEGRAEAGIVLCGCGGRLLDREGIDALKSRLSFAGVELADVSSQNALCTPSGRESALVFLAKRHLSRLVCAGCSPVTSPVARMLTEGGPLSPGSVRCVPVTGRLDADAREIRKALSAIAATPFMEMRDVELDGRILVLGSDETARRAASRAASLGHPVTLVGAAHGGVDSIPEGRLLRLEGQVGSFRATVGTSAGRAEVRCGALVVTQASATVAVPADVTTRFGSASVVGLDELPGKLAALPRESRVRTVGVVLDLDTEETKAGTEAALRVAARLQRTGVTQVHIFAHDMRVAFTGLQELYDSTRDLGVVVVKYDGKLTVSTAGGGVRIRVTDAGLGGEIEYACDLVGVSLLGLRSPAPGPDGLARVLGVGTDAEGRLQENNIHLLPALTSRTGIFVAGAARGQHCQPEANLEAEAAAAEAHALLAPGKLRVELSHAVVDADKCALCLTCVRVCPHGAMGIDQVNKAAVSSPEACRRCGICAGECPAKAITLPAWSDRGVLAQFAAAGAVAEGGVHA